MKTWIRLGFLALGGCASSPAPLQETAVPFLDSFEGYYSNYGQVAGDDGASNVMDLEVRRLGGNGFTAFLAILQPRDGGPGQSRIYRFDPAPGEGAAVLRIRILDPAQIEAGPDAWLGLARQGFDEGCVLALAAQNGQLSGHASPHTCRHVHPLFGEFGVFRQVRIGAHTFALDEFLVDGEENPFGEIRSWAFDRHRDFRATGAFRLPGPDGKTGPWRRSTAVKMRDDGRRVELFDDSGEPLGFALQLALLEWQSGQPDYLRLAVYHRETGALQAYYWAQPDADHIAFDRDWLQIRIEGAAFQSAE